MGYDGLADFKLKLAGSVSEGVPFIHRSVDTDDKTSDVMVKVVDNAVAAFLQYRNAASTDRKSTRLNSSHLVISYAVFCLKKKISAQNTFGHRGSCSTTVARVSHFRNIPWFNL